jgi:hypothetical protein
MFRKILLFNVRVLLSFFPSLNLGIYIHIGIVFNIQSRTRKWVDGVYLSVGQPVKKVGGERKLSNG